MALTSSHGAWAGLSAALAMIATPGAAAELPVAQGPASDAASIRYLDFSSSTYDSAIATSEWGCWNCWGGGWGRGSGWRRNRVRTGDVLAGAAIIGGITAIAVAASNNNRRTRTQDVVVVDRDRTPVDRRDNRRGYDDRRTNPRMGGASGLDGAVSQCLNTVERDVRVNDVETVQRTAQGWYVTGTLFNGSGFSCQIGNDGRIQSIDYGSTSFGSGKGAGQWDDSRYANARSITAPAQPVPGSGISWPEQNQMRGSAAPMSQTPRQAMTSGNEQPLVPLTTDRLPAYPGGPIDGVKLPPVAERPGVP